MVQVPDLIRFWDQIPDLIHFRVQADLVCSRVWGVGFGA
jgi:hypothetical protein